MAQRLKRLPGMQETLVRFLGQENLEKEMGTHSSILAWKIPWTEEPGRLQSTGSQRVGHDWATSLTFGKASLLAQIIKNPSQWRRHGFEPWLGKISWRREWLPTPYSCLGNPMDRGAWWATVHRVEKSQTWLSDGYNFLTTGPPAQSLQFTLKKLLFEVLT